jgi:hypothetical protein
MSFGKGILVRKKIEEFGCNLLTEGGTGGKEEEDVVV